MEKEILRQTYFKSAIVSAIAVGASATVFFLTWIPGAWMLGGFAVLYYGWTCLTLYWDVKGKKLVSVYAACIETTETKRRVAVGMKKSTTFRFTAMGEDETEAAFYISTTNLSEFRPGAIYCMLFRQNESGTYTENNLVTYRIMPPDIQSFAVGEDDEEVVIPADDKLINLSDHIKED